MISFAAYLLKAFVLSGLLYGYYRLQLTGGRFHRFNRFYLLGAAGLSLGVPLLPVWPVLADYGRGGALVLVRLKTFTLSAAGTQAAPPGWQSWAALAYGGVSLVFLIFLSAGLLKIARLIRGGLRERRPGYILVRSASVSGPFSFFRYICWPGTVAPEGPAAASMLRHERAHVIQWHSIDKLAMELIITMCWINPFFYLIRRELHLVHEFLADEASCKKGGRPAYARLLLSQALRVDTGLLANAFFHKDLSCRVSMLLGDRHPGPAFFSRGLAVVLAGAASLAICAFGNQPAVREGAVSPEPVIAFANPPMVKARLYQPSSVENREAPPSPPAPPSRTIAASSGHPRLFTFVEHMPGFPGGEAALLRYLSSRVHYPADARENSIQGTVVVQFVVETDGTLHHIRSAGRVPAPSLAAEAVRVVSAMPRWTPGVQNGHRVPVQFALPIRFVLQ